MLRFLVVTACAFVLTLIGFVSGWWLSDVAVSHALARLGTAIVTGPSDLLRLRLELAAAFAVPAPIAWIGVAIHQARLRRLPRAMLVAAAYALPAGAVLVGVALRVAFLERALPAPGTTPAIHLGLGSLALGAWGLELALLTLVPIVLVARRAS